MEIQWSEIETGFWVAECVCGREYHRDPVADRRVRLDPLDPKTSRHAGECEFASETDPSVLRVLLKVKPGMGGNYSWVECGSCAMGWQVADYAETTSGRDGRGHPDDGAGGRGQALRKLSSTISCDPRCSSKALGEAVNVITYPVSPRT